MADKKQKQAVEASTKSYVHFRSVGTITGKYPFVIERRANAYFVLIPSGSTFNICDVQTLNLVFAGPYFEGSVRALIADGEENLAISSNVISFCRRGEIVSRVQMKEGIQAVELYKDGRLAVCMKKAVAFLNLQNKRSPFVLLLLGVDNVRLITCDGYILSCKKILGGILLGTSKGELLFVTEQSMEAKSLRFDHGVLSLISTPVDEAVLVLLEDGSAHLYSIIEDKVMLSFVDDSGITSATFSDDGRPYLVTGSSTGTLKVWNLEHRRVDYIVQGHLDKVVYMEFLPQQNVCISTSLDNSIKVWALEGFELRMLKSREGHYKPIEKMLFLDGLDEQLVTTGNDGEVRLFSLSKDSRSCEFSQGSVLKYATKYNTSVEEMRLPVANDFDVFQVKSVKWANMVTCHKGLSSAYSWKLENKSIMEVKFQSTDNSELVCLCISPCGNFVAMGSRSGMVYISNIQSGVLRTAVHAFDGSAVNCVGYSANGSWLYAISEAGQLIKVDSATKRQVSSAVNIGKIRKCRIIKDMNAMAVDLADFSVLLIDLNSEQVVRCFKGHSNLITDICITADQKKLISASVDATVRVWDMETSLCLDVLSFDWIPKAIASSPNMEYLAIASNSSPAIHIFVRSSAARVHATFYDGGDVAFEDKSKMFLSGIERTKWMAMVNFEAFIANNKPVIIDDRLVRAPFFLDAVRTNAGMASKSSENASSLSSHPATLASMGVPAVIDFISKSSWSDINAELQSIEMASLGLTLPNLLAALQSKELPFDTRMICLNVILKTYRDSIAMHGLKDVLQQVKQSLRDEWTPVNHAMDRIICYAAHCRRSA